MTTITAKLVKKLEWETGVSRVSCLQALKNSNGDLGEAIRWLKQKGIYRQDVL